MRSGLSFLPAETSRPSIVSATGSSRKYAISAKLSSTLAGMALLECPFLLLVLGPVLRQRLDSRPALDDGAPAPNERRSHRFEKDSLRCGLHHGLGPVLDVELFAQAKRDHDLPLRREPYGFELFSHTHMYEYDTSYKVRQYIISRIICLREES